MGGEAVILSSMTIGRDRTARTVSLSQAHLTERLLAEHGMLASSPMYTPLPSGYKPARTDAAACDSAIRQQKPRLVGSYWQPVPSQTCPMSWECSPST